MNGDRILIDTNIVLYFLQGDTGVEKFFYRHTPNISFITELELLSGSELSQQTKQLIKSLLSRISIIEYKSNFKEIIIDIRAEKKLKLPDYIIAATAITQNLPLITADKSFQKIQGLDLILYEK